MTVRGTPRPCALVVARIEADFLKSPSRVTALGALVDEKTGTTTAYVNGGPGTWSTETLEKLNELREAMERDLAGRVFEDVHASSSTYAGRPGLQQPSGLAEHLGDEPPSI